MIFNVGFGQDADTVYYPNYQLKEVTVIADRIPSGDNPPFSVTKLDSSILNQPVQNLSLKERLLQVPGVYVQNAYNFAQDARISIRGFGANAAFGIRGIKLIVDGIPETTPDGTGQLDNLNLDQLGEIKVIRGSASSLYGNASGGAIVLKSSDFERNFLQSQSMVGSYDYYSQAFSGGIKNKNASYQGNVRLFGNEGFRDHSEFRQFNARFVTKQDFSENLSAVLLSELINSPKAQDAGGLTLEETQTDFQQARNQNVIYDAGESITQWKIGSSLKWKFSERGNLDTYAFFNRRIFDGRLPFENSGVIGLERNYFGVGNSIDLDAGIHSIKAGYDILSQRDDRKRYDNLEGDPGTLVFDQEEAFFNTGWFLLDNIDLNQWFISAGLRFDMNELKVEDRFLVDGDDTGSINMNNWSYHLSLGREIGNYMKAFFSHSTNFETPTLNQLSNRPDNSGGFEELDAATAKNFELGMKWNQNKLSLELVGFFIYTQKELVPFELAEFPERTFFQNAGKTLRKGIEFSSSFQSPHLDIYTTYSLSDFTYQTFEQNDVDLDGFRLPGIPRQHGTLNIIFKPSSKLTLTIPVQYVGKLWADSENETSVENYINLSLIGSYRTSINKVCLEPFFGIRNLTSQRYFDNIRINAFGNRYYEPAPRKNFYVGIKLRLD